MTLEDYFGGYDSQPKAIEVFKEYFSDLSQLNCVDAGLRILASNTKYKDLDVALDRLVNSRDSSYNQPTSSIERLSYVSPMAKHVALREDGNDMTDGQKVAFRVLEEGTGSPER